VRIKYFATESKLVNERGAYAFNRPVTPLNRRLLILSALLLVALAAPIWAQSPPLIDRELFFIPAILPLVLLIFWLIRVRFTNVYKAKSVHRKGDASQAAVFRYR
jgi:hypothetical protein